MGGGLNHPSVEPSGLTSAREIVPHTTSQEEKCVREKRKGADAREGGRTLEICRVSDSREGESNPRSRSLENRDAVSQHRGLSSGVASGKSIGSH
jgi:hypothetical protein